MNRRILKFLPLALLGLALVGALASGVTRDLSLAALLQHEAMLRGFIAAHLVVALLTFILAYAAATALSIPGATVLTLAGGYLFGVAYGGGATVIGATVGAALVFLAVRTSFGHGLRARAAQRGGRLAAIIDGLRAGAFGYVLTLRLIPFAPFWLVNVAAALADAPAGPYLLATFFGIMPATFIYSGVGAGIGAVVRRGRAPDLGVILEPHVLVPLVALALLSLITTLVQRLKARAGNPT